jgi:hypothetical protein
MRTVNMKRLLTWVYIQWLATSSLAAGYRLVIDKVEFMLCKQAALTPKEYRICRLCPRRFILTNQTRQFLGLMCNPLAHEVVAAKRVSSLR